MRVGAAVQAVVRNHQRGQKGRAGGRGEKETTGAGVGDNGTQADGVVDGISAQDTNAALDTAYLRQGCSSCKLYPTV